MTIKAHATFKRELKRLAKKYASIPDDYADLLSDLQENPTIGTPLGRDCYKIRMAISAKNKGKSGGSRVITCVKIENDIIHLLSIFDKSEQSTITDKELTNLLKQLEE
jgi:mRNA-degrading endonuclease RelE of RelBE toxin-antitoxin system